MLCVATVNVPVTAPVPEIAGGCATVQVGLPLVPAGAATAHASATFPVNPPLGVIVMVEVPLAPGALMLTAVPLTAKLGVCAGGFTTTATVAVCDTDPDVPVTVAV